MAKVLLDVILVEGTDKQEFVDSFNAETEADWWNMLGSMPNLLVMNVEEDFVETFRSHSSVVQATEIPEAFEASTPPSTEEMTKWMTSSTSSSHRDPSGDGADNAPVQFIYDANEVLPTDIAGTPLSVGRDDDSFSTGKAETFRQRWTGKHVDIVTLEVGPVASAYDGLHDTHPDFQKLSSEDDSHGSVHPYWYQCTAHSNMKNTITVNDADGTRENYNIAVSFGGSGIYTLSGSDRNGTVNGSNPPLVFQEGDTVSFSVTASGHPFEIRFADGGAAVSDGSVQNNGSDSGDVIWTLRTSSRVIPMDWPDLEGSSNNQVTNNNAAFSNHGIGVLSASGGTICGFAKKANLYAMYLVTGDSPTECIQAAIDWHNAKPNNPETGVPNPTIFIAEYQYLNDRRTAIPIDTIATINKADSTTVNRPSSATSDNSPYWYQCQAHPNMKNTITIGTSDGNPQNYTINVSFGGSGLYSLSGTDRNGSVSGNNPPLNIKDGDTITFSVNATGHPFMIRDGDQGNDINDGSVTGQGSTQGNVVLTTSTAGWGSDYSEFVKENIIPWKVYSPGSTEYEWCVVMPSQSEYSSLKTALDNAWNAGIVCINAAGNNGGTYNKQNSQTDTSLSIDPAVTPYNTIGISYGSNNVDSTNSTTTWYPFRSYGPHGVESNIDVAAGYNSEDYPGLDGYTNRGPGIDIVGLGANTYTAYQSSFYGSYRWGMFSGTSCATPTVVGKAACIMEEYFWYNGAWPTPDQTKELLLGKAANKARGFLSGGTSFSWSNVPSAGGASLSNEISFGNCQIAGGGGNGGYKYTELTGTTHLRAYFDPQDWHPHPYKMRSKHLNRRPSEAQYSGPTYPRTNNAVGRHRMELPDLT